MENTPPVDIGFDQAIIPRNSGYGWFDVSYKGNSRGTKSFRDGEIVFSDPSIADMNLFSRGFKTCLALAGISNQGKRVLAHICPGGYYPKNGAQFSTVYLKGHEHEIEESLRMWRDECGLDNNHLGMAGSCIFPDSPQERSRAYLETVKWMGDKLAKIFTGDPQILGLPTRGYGPEQHISVSDKIRIVRSPGFFSGKTKKTHISLNEIPGIVDIMLR